MKYNHIFRTLSCVLLAGLVSLGSACSDDFNVGNPVDEDRFQGAILPTAGVRNHAGRAGATMLEITDEDPLTTSFNIVLSRPASVPVDVVLTVGDAASVTAYNAEYGTNYTIYPTDLVALSESGMVKIGTGVDRSADIAVSLDVISSVDNDTIYALPLTAVPQTDGVRTGDVHMLLVKDLRGRKFASADKESGIRLFSCMEVNMANPLFHTSFMLKNSGKPLFDCVVLFSGYIVFDTDKQRVAFRPGTGLSAIIADYDKYIKPLHDMGMKVIFSVLGSDDGETSAGIAHLDDDTARYFAREIADFCRAYKLDGVFYDDEYTGTLTKPGFVPRSRAAAARLCYETKKAMPDKWVVCYMYGYMYNFSAVDDVQPGDFVDYGLNDYGRSYGASYFPGMTNAQIGIYSTNWSPGFWNNSATATRLRSVRNGGYGAYMGYCLDHQTSTWAQQLPQLESIAQYLYDDELVDLGYRPKPEW